MDLNRIPKSLHRLLAVVEEWGISDDGERDSKIYHASNKQLKKLVASLSDKDDEELDMWLCGKNRRIHPFLMNMQILIDRNELDNNEF
jgi:hypothetical protein